MRWRVVCCSGKELSKESPDDFKAPLGEQEFILDWAQSGYHRPIPDELKRRPKADADGDSKARKTRTVEIKAEDD